MSEKLFIKKETLDALGDGFRECLGTTDLYSLAEMIELAKQNRLRDFLNDRLEEIDLGDFDTLTKIRPFLFETQTNLVKVTLPDNLTSIGNDAFKGCTKLEEIIIPNNVQKVQWSAFYGCTGLKRLSMGRSVTELGASAFEGCTGLTEVILEDGVNSMGNSVFRNCTNLQKVVLPNTLQTMGGTVFQNCANLTDLTIGNGIVEIGSTSLQIGSSTNKATIKIKGLMPPTIQSDTFNASYLQQIIVPDKRGSVYKNATNWSRFASYIVEGNI